ncbi:MAG: hypothetical protein HBSAPP03_10120 [Phycisphaerae bacterium]|nr:MAG: hypothetical protein HBSAPP03_10120 [Phycisphaerae bacterium]
MLIPEVKNGSPASPAGPTFLRDGFRPFYLVGALFAALAVPLWLAAWHFGMAFTSLTPLLWHMHEMVFGFAVAIIIGFLFTAGRHWTGLPFPAGTPLALLVGLWLAGRVGMLFAYGPAAAILDLLPLPIVAIILARRFYRARSFANLPLVLVLMALTTANAAFHAAMHDLVPLAPASALVFAVCLVVLIEMTIGGRIIPGFTAGAFPAARVFRSVRTHLAVLALTAYAFLAHALAPASPWSGAAALLAGVAALALALAWNPLATRGRPILWILHAAYAWIPVGLILLGLSSFGLVPRSAALHAFAAGSMGGLIMGMMTRSALAHSGRPVRAGRPEVVMYALVILAGILRVAAALVPEFGRTPILAAGAAWSAAFLLFVIVYAPRVVFATPRG